MTDKYYPLIADLAKRRLNDVNDGLISGGIGVAMLMLLQNGYSEDNDVSFEQSAKDAAAYYKRCMSNQYVWMDYTFDGYLGFVWSLKVLERLNVIGAPANLHHILNNATELYTSYYQEMPIQYNPHDKLYPIGFVSMLFCDNEDTIASYFHREKTIHFIRDCEKILTEHIRFIHTPRNLTASQLHSILFFLMEADRFKLFPYKTRELIKLLKVCNWSTNVTNLNDMFIFDCLRYGVRDAISRRAFLPSDYSSLSYIGMFSFIYRMPEMFTSLVSDSFVDWLKKSSHISTLSLQTVIGLSMGFMAEKIYQ